MGKRYLKLAGIFAGTLLFAVTLFGITLNKSDLKTSAKSSDSLSCQIIDDAPPCTDNNSHQNSKDEAAHCQHCGHAHAGLLCDANINLLSSKSQKSFDSPEKTMKNVISDPALRPPNL